MEWTGIRLYKVEAECLSDKKFEGIAAALDVSKMEVSKPGALRIDFSYATEYRPQVARIKFYGFVSLEGKKGELESLLSRWKRDKFIDKENFEALVNLIKFTSETNGVLVAKALNIAPPLVGPKIRLSGKPGKKK
jgi:hypothetical protein